MGASQPEGGRRCVLITGVTGLVGTHLAAEFISRGWRVRGAVRSATSGLPSTMDIVPFQVGDIGPQTDWSAAMSGVDVVVHAAAHVHVPNPTALDHQAFHRVNVLGTQRLAECAKLSGIARVVYISSIGVHGSFTRPKQVFRADDSPLPHNAYNQSKYKGEQALIDVLANSSTTWSIVRPPLVFGPGGRGNFPRLVALVRSGLPLPLAGLENRRSLVSVYNLADFVVMLAQHPNAASRVWLVADDGEWSTPALLKMIAQHTGRRLSLFRLPGRLLSRLVRTFDREQDLERLTQSLVIDSSDARAILGWSPPLGLEEGLQRALN